MEGAPGPSGGDDQPVRGKHWAKKQKQRQKRLAKEEKKRLADEEECRRLQSEAEKAVAEKKEEEALANRRALNAAISDEAIDEKYNSFYNKLQKDKRKNKGLKIVEGNVPKVDSDTIEDTEVGKNSSKKSTELQGDTGNQEDPDTEANIAGVQSNWSEDSQVQSNCSKKNAELQGDTGSKEGPVTEANIAGVQSNWSEDSKRTATLKTQLEIAGIEQARVQAIKAGKQPAQTVEQDSKHVEMFEDFLASYTKSAVKDVPVFYYKAYVGFMKILNTYELQVDFTDILSDKKYKSLAVRIGKSKDHGWLYGGVARFLKANGIEEDIDKLLLKVSLSFINLERLKPLDAFMKSELLWRITANKERPLTEHGSTSFWLLIAHVVKMHKRGRSYKGQFKEDDILLGKSFCWIYTQHFENEPNASYAADYKCTWNTMSPFYNDGGIFPQNFSVLKDCLHMVYIDQHQVKSSWFRDFILYCETLAPSDAKRAFIAELRRTVITFNLQHVEFLECVPSGPWQKWSSRSGSQDDDWTIPVKESPSPVLKGVFSYESNKPSSNSVDQKGKPNQQGAQGKGISKGSQTGLPKGKTHSAPNQRGAPPTNSQPSTSQKAASGYSNTVWGMLSYDRCVIEHGAKHCGDVIVVENEKSMEIHASQQLPFILVFLLYSILTGKATGKPNMERLDHAWVTYKKLFPYLKD